jgi:hypothetical protein
MEHTPHLERHASQFFTSSVQDLLERKRYNLEVREQPLIVRDWQPCQELIGRRYDRLVSHVRFHDNAVRHPKTSG